MTASRISLTTFLVLCCVLPGRAQKSATPPSSSLDDPNAIVFASNRGGNWDIYTIKPDGSGLKRLTDHAADDQWPAWSPDGRSIAFVSDRDGEAQVFLMKVDGRDVEQLTDSRGLKRRPTWAPHAQQIAFEKRSRPGFAIRVLTLSNNSITTLHQGSMPAWSPDGKTILAVSGNLAGLVSIDVSGGMSRPVFSDDLSVMGALVISSAWSPDGHTIAFSRMLVEDSERRSRQSDLYIANADGTEPRRLTHTKQWEVPYCFSSDAKALVFGSGDTSQTQLYIMDVEGTGRRRLTDGRGSSAGASWLTRIRNEE